MADVEFIKTPQGLAYASEDDREKMKRIGKLGSLVRGKFSAPRHGKFHRKCRVLQDTIYDNQEMFTSTKEGKEDFREWLKLKTGCYEWKNDPIGNKYPKTLSTSYDKMDEVRHAEWYQELITFAIQDGALFSGKTPDEANSFIDKIIGGFC